jgi:putative membrane protein
MDICGACERIQKTPIARTYKEMIWCGLGLYTLILPWLLVPTIDVWTLPIVFVSSYFIYTLELLAEEVEEPFGTNPNDLPLDTICKTIEDSVRQAFAHDTKAILPEPIQAEA